MKDERLLGAGLPKMACGGMTMLDHSKTLQMSSEFKLKITKVPMPHIYSRELLKKDLKSAS